MIALLLNVSGWMLAALAPIIYAWWRSGRDLLVVAGFGVLQVLFGVYTWRISAAYHVEKRASRKRA